MSGPSSRAEEAGFRRVIRAVPLECVSAPLLSFDTNTLVSEFQRPAMCHMLERGFTATTPLRHSGLFSSAPSMSTHDVGGHLETFRANRCHRPCARPASAVRVPLRCCRGGMHPGAIEDRRVRPQGVSLQLPRTAATVRLLDAITFHLPVGEDAMGLDKLIDVVNYYGHAF